MTREERCPECQHAHSGDCLACAWRMSDQYKADRDELSGWINALLSENSRYIRALSAIVAQTEYGPMLTDSVIQQAREALSKVKGVE